MQRVFSLFFTLCFSIIVSAQTETIMLAKNAKGQVLNTNTGIVLVKTSKKVVAINSSKQKNVLWENKDLKKVDFSSYTEIPFTPYVIFSKKPFISSKLLSNALGTKGVSKTLVNVLNGNVFFDSEKQGFKAVNNTLILPEQKAVLVDGIKNKKYVLSLFDFQTGKLIWETNLSDRAFFKNIKGALLDQEITQLDSDKNIFWLKNNTLLKVASKTGEVLFHQKNTTSFNMNLQKDVIYVFANKIKEEKLNEETVIQALSTKDLKPLWKHTPKITGHISQSVFINNELITITSKGFNIINVTEGIKKWDRSETLPLIKKIVPVSSGYLVVQENFLTKVDTLGKKAWKKKVKITKSSNELPIHILEDAQTAMYLTPSFSNRITIEDGSKIWEKDVVLNKAGFISRNLKLNHHYYQAWFDQTHDLFPVYNENNFYIFNPKATTAPSSLQKFDFGREIPHMEIREKGYFMTLNNQFYFFHRNGSLVYQKKLPYQAKGSFFSDTFYWVGRGIGTARSVIGFIPNQIDQTFKNVLVSTNLGFVTRATSSIYGTYQSYKNTLNDITQLNSLGLDSDLLSVFSRFNKGQKNDNFSIVVSTTKDKKSSVIQLEKDTGATTVLKEIDFEFDQFIIDQIEKVIYFFDGKKVIIENLITK